MTLLTHFIMSFSSALKATVSGVIKHNTNKKAWVRDVGIQGAACLINLGENESIRGTTAAGG